MNVARFIATPYAELDCYELLQRIYEDELGIVLPDLDDVYQVATVPGWKRIDGSPQEGDVILFYPGSNEMKKHVGMVIDPARGKMIHTTAETDAVVERYTGPVWKGRLKAIYRHKALQ